MKNNRKFLVKSIFKCISSLISTRVSQDWSLFHQLSLKYKTEHSVFEVKLLALPLNYPHLNFLQNNFFLFPISFTAGSFLLPIFFNISRAEFPKYFFRISQCQNFEVCQISFSFHKREFPFPSFKQCNTFHLVELASEKLPWLQLLKEINYVPPWKNSPECTMGDKEIWEDMSYFPWLNPAKCLSSLIFCGNKLHMLTL